MREIFALILTLVMVCGVLAGCGKTEGKPEDVIDHTKSERLKALLAKMDCR